MPKIIIVEDDEMLQGMYGQKFQMEGYQVFSAFNGADGMKMIEAEKPDIILLDVIMPKMDGFVALKKIRKHSDSVIANTPVILLTNLGQEEDVRKGRELGANDYFIKANHTPQDVLDKVKALLKKWPSVH